MTIAIDIASKMLVKVAAVSRRQLRQEQIAVAKITGRSKKRQ